MARKKEGLAKTFDRFVGEFSPQDVLIMGAGFVAGTQGYTPLTMMISNFNMNIRSPFALIDTQQIKDTRVQAGSAAANAGFIGGLSPAAAWAEGMFGLISGGLGIGQAVGSVDQAAQGLTQPEKQAVQEARMHMIALGCVGMIEAYAITRPNFLSGVGQIVQGIGQIVPG